MATDSPKPKLVVIVGPTASGKSALAMKVAQQHGGEIIAADSRTIYKGMDIGTAKPSRAERAKVPHWGVDLVSPGQSYSAAKFKNYAEAKILEIQQRGKLPIMVGGTGLYVDGVLFDYEFIKPNRLRRLIYGRLPANKLQNVIRRQDWPMPENINNPRHLLRSIERKGQIGNKSQIPRSDALIIGLMPPDEVLRRSINIRADKMFASGVVPETELLLDRWGAKAVKTTGGIIYSVCLDLIKKEISLAEAKDRFKKADWQYARRQRTWFKRNPFVQWFEHSAGAERAINKALNT